MGANDFTRATHGNYYTSEDFDGFRARGMQVHLDDLDLTNVWAHLARADVMVVSRSSFSYIPAVINRRCVIFPGYTTGILSNWIDGTSEAIMMKEFDPCMDRATAK